MKRPTRKSEPGRSSPRREYETTRTVHKLEPDYSKPVLEIPPASRERMLGRLRRLYGEALAREHMPELERVLKVYYAHKSQEIIDRERELDPAERFTEKDVILITYGDLLRGEGKSPLAALAAFCDGYLEGTINTLHILPFFPYSSDRGFSIIDFETVDPNLGSWEDIEDLENRYQLMFDGVINHVSSKSRWFHEFQNRTPYYKDFFIAYSSPDELTREQRKLIFRPRTSDILTSFQTLNGPIYVWTTFSRDQVDLDYANPNVLLRVIEILLMYVRRGADILRLDAVTFLWAEPGTPCANLEETHEIVKLIRDVMDTVAPSVALVTETNIPHEENVSYFGNGRDEAQMVYNFALPPLVLYTFYKEDASLLSRWVAGLETPSDTTAYFNFLDSHDGIGVMAARNILAPEEIDFIIRRAKEHGGRISYKTGENGAEEPYEINITWFSALNDEGADEDVAFQVKRFVASRIVALVLRGVPGIYLHSLIGTRNDIEAVLASESKRAINRTVIDGKAINEALEDPLSKISRINRVLGRLITIRTRQRAFHPRGKQQIPMLSPDLFAVLRVSPEGDQHLLCLTNVTNKVLHLEVPVAQLGTGEAHCYDLVSGMEWMADGDKFRITLNPYDVAWLIPISEKEGEEGVKR